MASVDPILWLQAVLPAPAEALLVAVTHAGSGPVYGAAAGALTLAWDRRRGYVLAAALLVGGAANVLLKDLFGWPRPPERLHRIDVEGLGFPSGHAQTNGVFWGTLARMRPSRPVAGAGAAAVVLVSLSRVALGVHHVRDVAAGAAAGLLLAGLVWAAEAQVAAWLRGAPAGPRLALAAAGPVPLAFVGLRGAAPLLSGALAGLGSAYVLEGEAFPDRPTGAVPLAGGLAVGAAVGAPLTLLPAAPMLDWAGAFAAVGAAVLAGPQLARRQARE